MNEFNPLKVNSYTIIELADMIEGGIVTKDEVYACGLAAPKRPELEAELNKNAPVSANSHNMNLHYNIQKNETEIGLSDHSDVFIINYDADARYICNAGECLCWANRIKKMDLILNNLIRG